MKHIREEMELFIPSLIVLVLSALVCFFILPKLSPYVLGGLAVAMFGLGIWQHYSTFPYEYRASMATDILKQYSGFLMLLGVIFSAVVVMMMSYGGNPPVAGNIMPAMPNMPAMPAMPAMPNIMGNNNGKGMFNLAGNNNAAAPNKPANNAVNKPANAVPNKPANNNSKKNNLASASFKTV